MARTALRRLTLLLIPILLGCGQSSVKLAPVSGRVTYRGHGVSKATVQLIPDTGRGTHAPAATGQTGEDSSFTLQMPPHGAGAVPGHYRVTIQHYHSAVPARYGNPAQTLLHVEVPAEGLTDWQVRLKD